MCHYAVASVSPRGHLYRCAANFNAVRIRSFSRPLWDLASDTTAAAEREKAKKKAAQQSAQSSRVGTPSATPKRKKTSGTSSGGIGSPLMSGTSTPVPRRAGMETPDQQLLDFTGLNLQVEEMQIVEEEIPKVTLAREKLLEEVAKVLQTGVDGKKGVSLVVIGNVSTFMGFFPVLVDGSASQVTSMLESRR